MAENTGAQQQDKPRSDVRSPRRRVKNKQFVSIWRSAAVNEMAEDHAKGVSILEQRAAVRRPSGGVLSTAPGQAGAHTESRFAHDLSRVRTHTVPPESGPAIQPRGDIRFWPGQFRPNTAAGQRLMGHELAPGVHLHGDQRVGAVARQLIPPAEARARGTRHTWLPLPAGLRTRLEGMVADPSQRPAVLQEMWSAIRGGLTHRNRVTVELTQSLGVVNGQRVARVGMGQGVTLAYVNATPGCAAVRDDAHLSAHRALHQTGAAAQIRAIIQVNPNIFHTAASEAVSNLYSLLMHEYLHVEQSIARGVHQGVRFVVAGSREFLSEEELPTAERQAVEGLDEIEALCAEIENATSTGLDVSFSMRNTIDYLWSAYENYHDALSDPRTQIDRQIARRVYQDLWDGTQALLAYLRSPAAQWLTPSLRNDARRPPQGYVAAKIAPYR